MTNTTELVKAVKAYANEHYGDRGGWDFVVECWEDSEIAEEIEGAQTAEQAIEIMSTYADAMGEQRAAACLDM